MSGAVSQIDSLSSSSSSSSSCLPIIFQIPPHESSLPNNNKVVEDDEITTSNPNPWKKINGSQINDLMATSWPALSNPFPLPHEVCSPALERERGAKDIQTSAAYSANDNISKDNEHENFVSSSLVSSCVMDPVQKLITELEKSSENSSSSTEEGNTVSASRYKNEQPSNIVKKTLSVNVGNEDKERPNSSDYGRTTHHINSQQRSFTSRLKQKPKLNQNQSNYSGIQNHKTSNRHQQTRPFNDRNTGWKQSNSQPVSSPNNIPGFINGFVGPQLPSSPYAYSHFTPVSNPPPLANVPFLPFPYSIHPQTQYPTYMPMGFYENPYFPAGGLVHHPQAYQMSNFQGQDVNLYYAIRHQIEYYFSDVNLANDFYLRNHMDAFGWVSVDVIAAFNKVNRLTKDVDLILKALQPSLVVEIQGNNIRKRVNWKTWILPNSLLNKFQNIQLDSKSETKKLSVDARRVSDSSSEY